MNATMTRAEAQDLQSFAHACDPASEMSKLCDALLAEMEARDLDLQAVQALREEVEGLTTERDQIAAEYHRAAEDLDTLAQAVLADPAVVPTAGETTATTAARVIGEVRAERDAAVGRAEEAEANNAALKGIIYRWAGHDDECKRHQFNNIRAGARECICGYTKAHAAAHGKDKP